ncbi:SGNH/GDSL hydrolase family protein [Carnobacterium sp. ISL-102]|uniref:SGNH/GDSL hydrolase family protein n=1 Tax=Carnobacterium sp. ISL-102 TaxID=2819142 RepID=UPI001BEC4483|nr:SGNH/GDSL hydrolase family protein [Carnobacterium sp. ISL-102]MBT2731506.1 SGNH/GDSL hydrolase family protein [Carnobacterium sp. ISL-102]
MKKGRLIVIVFLFLSIGSIFIANTLIDPFQSNLSNDKDGKDMEIKKESLHIVAIGDSLTEGIGDATKSGGYVPIVADLLEETDGYKEVTTSNYGKNGDRSDQVLERFHENKSIQEDIASANIVVLTVGGNDIVQTLKKIFLTANEESFTLPEKTYRVNLKALLADFKRLNPELELYVFGIYNPYYVYFPEITEMQNIVDKWNQTTQEIVNETDNATFISTVDLFNPTIKQDEVKNLLMDEENSDGSESVNPYLYEKDLFHPNEAGYELMGKVLFQAIEAE